MNIQYKNRTMLFRLKLMKNGSQSGQPGTIELLKGKGSAKNRPTIEVATPIIAASMSQATNRSSQKANFGSQGATGVVDSSGGADDEDASSIATAVPHLGQNLASSGSSFPQFLQ